MKRPKLLLLASTMAFAILGVTELHPQATPPRILLVVNGTAPNPYGAYLR